MLSKLRRSALVAIAAAVIAVPAMPAPALAQTDDCEFFRPTASEVVSCARYILRNLTADWWA